ncbi:MAG: hypothetical protein MI919_11330, partial [Holophagales bacterium]|nr:hypothetical protein [Holophagales bacterium]
MPSSRPIHSPIPGTTVSDLRPSPRPDASPEPSVAISAEAPPHPSPALRPSPGFDLPISFTREEVLRDYRLAAESRQASLVGRREVLTGKA